MSNHLGAQGTFKDRYFYRYVRLFIDVSGSPLTPSKITCCDGGNTFTPERYRLELNSAHTFTGRQAPSDPHTVSGVFFLRKQNWSAEKNHRLFAGASRTTLYAMPPAAGQPAASRAQSPDKGIFA